MYKPAPGEEHVQFYHVSETLDEVISAYRAANPKVKQTDYVHLRAWDLQRRSISDAIVKRTGYCRRVGCYPHSLETTVGKLVAQTMTDATSILNCEVWQMGHSETDIEAALLKIYRTLLGVENETPFGLSPASIFGRSNVDHAQRYVPLLWSRLRDDYTYYF